MPIVMTKEEWGRITRWTDSGREDPEVVRRREYVQYLNNTSHEMTKNWPNSLENVNKRSEEMRRARVEAAEKANTKFYQRYVKNQREQQQRLMYSAGDTVFKNKDAPKLLLRAVIETATQKERQEQIKFKQRLQQEVAEEKRRDDDDIIRKAKEWHELMEVRRKRRFDVNKQHQKDILDQAIEVSERNRKEYETESNLQKIDNIQAGEQMDAIKKFEKKFRAEEKARIFSDMQRSRDEAAARRLETDTRARVDDQLIHVLQRTRARIERRSKRTERQIQEEKQLVLEKISQNLESGDAVRDQKEQKILEKAVSEKEAIAEARRQAEANKQAKIRAERAAVQAQFLQRQEQSLHEFHTIRQWELMNRFKNIEIYQDFQEQLRDEKERKIKQYREDIIKQWHERDDRDARERADTRYFYGELAESKLRASDNKLLTHGAALLGEARRAQRPTHALTHALQRYCKLYRLYPMPELPDSMQGHYPRYAPVDLSRPDDDYRFPQPPVFDDDAGKQQPKPQAALAPVAPDPNDYRRAAPANGLQRKPGKTDLKLPAVSKSVEPQCCCECKK